MIINPIFMNSTGWIDGNHHGNIIQPFAPFNSVPKINTENKNIKHNMYICRANFSKKWKGILEQTTMINIHIAALKIVLIKNKSFCVLSRIPDITRRDVILNDSYTLTELIITIQNITSARMRNTRVVSILFFCIVKMSKKPRVTLGLHSKD